MTVQLFQCPDCHAAIDAHHGVAVEGGCQHCQSGYLRSDGVLDFVTSTAVGEERGFYDAVYQEASSAVDRKPPASFWPLWHGSWAKQDELVLDAVGDITGKTVVIIGNGTSEKELALLDKRPGTFVYSDLSPIAAATMRSRVTTPEGTQAYFCAIDAHRLPLQDNSVDLLYGYAMVHHLPRLEEFFEGVVRILKPGGKAVFMDDAYAPAWHFSKMTFARPLMKLSHKRTGISPEDLRFSLSGGFREVELEKLIRAAGAAPYFNRVSFFNYLWYRAAIKLFPGRMRQAMTAPIFDRATASLDRLLLRSSWGEKNQIRIVWGLSKPALPAA